MTKTYTLEHNPLFQKLLPEVLNVASDMDMFAESKLSEDDAKAVTQRICEDRDEDSQEFREYLTDVEELDDDDDWSDVNGSIERMIEKVMIEKAQTA